LGWQFHLVDHQLDEEKRGYLLKVLDGKLLVNRSSGSAWIEGLGELQHPSNADEEAGLLQTALVIGGVVMAIVIASIFCIVVVSKRHRAMKGPGSNDQIVGSLNTSSSSQVGPPTLLMALMSESVAIGKAQDIGDTPTLLTAVKSRSSVMGKAQRIGIMNEEVKAEQTGSSTPSSCIDMEAGIHEYTEPWASLNDIDLGIPNELSGPLASAACIDIDAGVLEEQAGPLTSVACNDIDLGIFDEQTGHLTSTSCDDIGAGVLLDEAGPLQSKSSLDINAGTPDDQVEPPAVVPSSARVPRLLGSVGASSEEQTPLSTVVSM
jgi:hypothetical protein